MQPLTGDPADQRVHGGDVRLGGAHDGWGWREPGLHGNTYRTCSYCGSIHPEDLVRDIAVTNYYGGRGWADFKYGWPHKYYADVKNRDPEAWHVVSHTKTPDYGPKYKAWVDLTPEQRFAVSRDYASWTKGEHVNEYWWLDQRELLHVKLYSVHLKDENLSQETLDEVAKITALTFTWLDDGRVSWAPTVYPENTDT